MQHIHKTSKSNKKNRNIEKNRVQDRATVSYMFRPGIKRKAMEKKNELTLRKIFRYLMENGYCPTYEKTHIIFGVGSNMAVMEYEESVLSLRLFFSIEEEEYGNFLEASNECMTSTFMVKSVILDDMKNLMFSCETLCDTFRDFQRFFPRMLSFLAECLETHKQDMREILIAENVFAATGRERKMLS